jgi:hypothetical protein
MGRESHVHNPPVERHCPDQHRPSNQRRADFRPGWRGCIVSRQSGRHGSAVRAPAPMVSRVWEGPTHLELRQAKRAKGEREG